MKSLKKFLKAKGYTRIPLALTKTNHFEITAKINGIAGRFILDTGASNTCIGIDRTAHFNLVSETSEVKAAGAGSVEMETMLAKNNKIQLGSWKKKKQKIVLFSLAHVNEALTNHEANPVDGIIGADILKKGKAIIDYNKKYLYLR
ncbi:retropepsin-like aspartic protease [uncultured Croceitalea sp.]|uniref:retropepsin-like aspartic protease family protein n=1 Tax=uncultured Croceitalea sp. TaxID=1798908 RepID=UPI003305F33C